VLYCEGDRSLVSRKPLAGSSLTFTFVVVSLLALAALAYYFKHLGEKRTDRRAREKKASRHKETRAAADRLACLELARGLNASTPAEESADGTSAPLADSPGEPPSARSRRSSEAPQGFDPDLPPRRVRPSAP
jgi:hypothetical protein